MIRSSHRCLAGRLGVLAVSALISLVALPACRRKAPAVDPGYLAQIEKWRAERLASLTAEDGWLTVVGLSWLRPGENRFGSDPGNEVVLPHRDTPALAGNIELRQDGTALLHSRPGTGLTLGGSPATERVLASDRTGRPDILGVGSIRFYLIDRGGKLAVRVKDPHSPRRVGFSGIRYYAVDPAYRVSGSFEPYPAPREVAVATVQGPEQKMLAPGVVRFTLRGQALALEPFVSSPEDDTLFIVFSDATSGSETYGAGRFLDAAAPAKGSRHVALDFNRAYSPPCAFTPYATCTLPPRQNQLPVRIEAGEKFSGGH
jgi:uncharacterized protein (DUF1684 family)